MSEDGAVREWLRRLSLARLEELAVIIAVTIEARQRAEAVGRIARCEIIEDDAVLSLVVTVEVPDEPAG